MNTKSTFVVLVAFLVVCLVAFSSSPLNAQVFDERMDDWPLDLKINGTVLASASSTVTKEQLDYFRIAAGGEEARIVVIDLDPDAVNSMADQLTDIAMVKKFVNDQSSNFSELSAAIQDTTGVWISDSGSLNRQQVKYLAKIEKEFAKVVERGGVVFGSGLVTRTFGKHQILGGQMLGNVNQATISQGLNLIPDTVLQVNYEKESGRRQLASVLGSHPRCVGIGIDRDTILLLRGRKIRALGAGELHFLTMANDRMPVRRKSISNSESEQANRYEAMIDLTAWRRDAIDRTLPVFPPAERVPPKVENGTLILIGGGGVPDMLMESFISRAGGVNARLVFVPCTERDEFSRRDSRLVQAWIDRGVASAEVFHTKDRNKANSDEEFLKPLQDATGIFFGGGRQWNFSDSYYGTEAHRLMKEVLNRGGVIAGSSAGASIQGRYLARADPLGNRNIMAPGYERGGLGFLEGVAIDQHFTQRNRQPDMTQLVNRYPQLLGIGLDESTAIIVRKSMAKVVGDGDVYFYDRAERAAHDDPDYIKVSDGQKFDLAKRKVIEE